MCSRHIGENFERRKSLLHQILNSYAQISHHVDELADGALPHAGVAVENIFAAADGGHGGEKTRAGAGISAVKIGLGVGDFSIGAVDENLVGILVNVEFEAEAFEAVEHDVGVVGEEAIGEFGLAGSESGDDQGAVGETFGAGRGEFGGEGFVDGLESDVAHSRESYAL